MTQERTLHFLVLILILGGGLGMFYYARGDAPLQLAVGIVTAVSYVAWGLLHHAMQQDLHKKIVIEYILIGALAVMLLLIILGA